MVFEGEYLGLHFKLFYGHGALKLSNGQAESRFSELYKEEQRNFKYCYCSGFLAMFLFKKKLFSSEIPIRTKLFRVLLSLSIIQLGSQKLCNNEELEQLSEELGYKYKDQVSTLRFSIGR
mmetsp:Transcript_7314/g.10809  ORF Transcript_7314/g.10809 Transcript_7314/m.10809 type:complete len:120 (-) Transcript_7314:1629-1988(-)